jgi:DNA-binding response OmpR family regulator
VKFVVIENDPNVVRDAAFCLAFRYPEADILSTGQGSKAMEMIEDESPDLVMLASSLPGTDIIKLITKIREYSDVPLLMLSDAKNNMDVARYLEAGADDAISKPCSPIELLCRTKALFRRTRGSGYKRESSVSFGGHLTINFDTHEVTLSGKRVGMTPIEYQILLELVRNEGRVLTNHTLLEKAWGSEYADDSSYVKKYIYRLRSKLEPDANSPQMILNERGMGYKFVGPTA